MVTGVETAGLILGALPIIIEALKSYQSGVKTLKKLRKRHYGIELRRLLREVEQQQAFLEDDVKKLLFAACPTYNNLHQLGDDDMTELRSKETQVAVKRYLGEKRYGQFGKLLHEFEGCLIQLAEELDHLQCFDRKGTVNASISLFNIRDLVVKPPNQDTSFFARFKYIFGEADIILYTNELASFTKKMDRILANSKTLHEHLQEGRLDPESNPRLAISTASLLEQIRIYTDRLFRAFHEAWATGCHPSHEAILFLDTPLFTKTKILGSKMASYKFRLMLRESTVDISAWHETDVTVSEESAVSILPNSSTPTFVGLPSSQPMPTISISDTKISTNQQNKSVVEDLCRDFAHAKHIQKCLDLHLCQGTSFVSDKLHWPKCERTGNWNIVSLEHLLVSKWSISPSQRNSIALKLAASLLQLKTSQWLAANWSNKSIYFPRIPNATNSYNIDVSQPLILQTFSDPSVPVAISALPRLMFLELGILLLELWNEESFFTFAKNHCNAQEIHASMRQGLANDWYDVTYHTMTNRYGAVVRTCVNFAGEHSQGSQSWDDEQLRMSVCAKIIRPLKEECSVFP